MTTRTRRLLTEEEHVRLVMASTYEHPVLTTFGQSGVWLLPDPVNEWAFALLDQPTGDAS